VPAPRRVQRQVDYDLAVAELARERAAVDCDSAAHFAAALEPIAVLRWVAGWVVALR